MNEECTQKKIERLCQNYSKETGAAFTNYYDPKFLEWLEKSNPTNEDKKQKFYTFIESDKFSQAIMEAYMTSMNDVSKKLDNQKLCNKFQDAVAEKSASKNLDLLTPESVEAPTPTTISPRAK